MTLHIFCLIKWLSILLTMCKTVHTQIERELNLQTFVLYNLTDPDPTSSDSHGQIFNGNYKDLFELSDFVKQNTSRSWCSIRQGVWLFYSEPNFSVQSAYYGFVKTARGTNATTAICKSLQSVGIEAAYNQIRSIRHMDHANLSQPALSLFTSVDGVHAKELFIDGVALSLPYPILFSSYSFTGKRSWRIFSGPNYTGFSTCLTLPLDYTNETDDTVPLVSFGANIQLIAWSMRLNCMGNEYFIQKPFNASIQLLSIQGSSLSSVMPSLISNPNKSLEIVRQPTSQHIELPGIELNIASSSEAVLFFAGDELVLTEPLMVTQINFIRQNGNNSSGFSKWGLYSDLDFTGKGYCIRGSEAGHIFEDTVLVMSIKYGCLQEDMSSFSMTLLGNWLIILLLLKMYYFFQ